MYATQKILIFIVVLLKLSRTVVLSPITLDAIEIYDEVSNRSILVLNNTDYNNDDDENNNINLTIFKRQGETAKGALWEASQITVNKLFKLFYITVRNVVTGRNIDHTIVFPVVKIVNEHFVVNEK